MFCDLKKLQLSLQVSRTYTTSEGWSEKGEQTVRKMAEYLRTGNQEGKTFIE